MLIIKERKMIVSLKQQVDVKIAGFGLKIRRLENECRSTRGKLNRSNERIKILENEIKILKGE